MQGPWILAGAVSYSYSFPVPAVPPALIGQVLYAQAAVFAPGVNVFGAVTSNGMQGTFGDL